MIATDGRPTIASGSRAELVAQARADDAAVVSAAEAIAAEAAGVKCPTCEAPDNGEDPPVITGRMGRYGQFVIIECQCCGEAWHEARP